MMKKYLMTGIAALAISAGFTSCSKDDFEPMTQAQIDKAKYDQAFRNYVGGTIAAGQTWGFGNTNASRAFTRAFTPSNLSSESSWDGWVSAPAAEDYKTEVPTENCYPMNEYWRGTGTYYVQDATAPNGVVELQPYNGNAIIYMSGSKKVSFTNPGDGADNVRFYVIPGADIHFTTTFNYQKAKNLAMYIAPGAKVTFDQDMSANVIVYNKGEFVVEGICGPYDKGAIYNDGGTITCKKTLNVFNNNSQVINNGNITVYEDVNIEGSGHFRNAEDGVITVTGNTIVNSNNCSWINDGNYRTGDFSYTAGSTDVKNNCMLTVDNLFFIDLGETDKNYFQLNGGAGVLTKDFKALGPGYIYMGSNSVFKVTDTAYMGITKDEYGIYGPATGDYAVFQAKNVVRAEGIDANQGFVVNYFQNLYVVAETHFENGYSDKSAEQQANGEVGVQPYYRVADGAALYVNNEKPNIKILASDCNPGFEGDESSEEPTPGDDPTPSDDPTDDPVEETTLGDLRIMGEDLSAIEAGDFDFNDIVIDVKFDASNAILILRAAGGTLPLRIAENDQWEVHTLFGVGEKVMVNTAHGRHHEYEPVEIKLPFGVTSPAEAKNIKLEVMKSGEWQELTAEISEPAAKLAVGTDCEWLDERTSIKDVYKSFVEWASENPNLSQWWKQ